MGRENMADYNADFLTMLQTWDAAVQHLESKDSKPPQPIGIATLLGWNMDRSYRDATINYSTRGRVENVQPIELTRLIGWTQDRSYRDAAVNFWTSTDVHDHQPIEIANLLGWTPKRTLGA